MSTTYNTSMPFVTDGDSVAAAFNRPLQVLADRTDYLKGLVETLSNKVALVLPGVSLAPGLSVGMPVYYDAPNGRYAAAFAQWTTGTRGEVIPAASCRVAGILTEKTTDTTGTLLQTGLGTNELVYDYITSNTAASATYYLGNTAGTYTTTPEQIKIPIACTDLSGSYVVNTFPHNQPNHIHKKFELTEDWYAVADPLFDEMTKPAGATFGYNIAADTALSELFALYPGDLTIFYDGVLLTDTTVFEANADNIWFKGVSAPTDSVIVFAYMPFLNGEPLVRAVTTDTPAFLTTTLTNGLLTVSTKEPSEVALVGTSGTAISNISGNVITRTHVISKITAGEGVSVSTLSDGTAIVSLESFHNSLHVADLVNMNNAVQSVEAPFVWTVLPANRSASISCRCIAPKFDTEALAVKAQIWATVRGIDGGTDGTPKTFPALTVTAHSTALPAGEGRVELAADTIISTATAVRSTAQGYLYYTETPLEAALAVTSESVIHFSLAAASAVNDKYLLQFGVKFTIENYVGTGSASGNIILETESGRKGILNARDGEGGSIELAVTTI